jgi:hypothetical protein
MALCMDGLGHGWVRYGGALFQSAAPLGQCNLIVLFNNLLRDTPQRMTMHLPCFCCQMECNIDR